MTNAPQILPKLDILANETKTIAIFGFDDAQLLDISGPLQAFSTANDVYEGTHKPYKLVTIADKTKIRTSSGLELCCAPFISSPKSIDTLIISGGKGINQLIANNAALEWIKNVHQSARRFASVCSGAAVLARLGLLDHKKATTHWRRIGEFQKNYPCVLWTSDAIFICNGKIWTSAGITAGIDMALAMIEQDLGFALAKSVARQLVVYLRRPGGQSQFSEVMNLFCEDKRFNILNKWIGENLSQPLAIADLAKQCAMSERNFSRLYKLMTGVSPAKAIALLRLDAAKHYLEQNWPIKKVVSHCGFGSEETLRRVFQRHLAISPQAYRQRFSTLLDN
ncbi:GlxA family transcriptional regulator [uncultured Bartonella sp.]|uniref:GlxA family transcriptional regulator n=1 Tax=uncultured Bartonella sp. TaxID=104108 RepID=UPI00260401A6|nr:GlxA family transcriptional regulator [uncultured Bartonella sp.]